MAGQSKLSLYMGLLRPKTLLSGLSSVIVPVAYAYAQNKITSWAIVACLVGVAVLAQIASNIVNDLIDFHKGVDTDERKGPLRPLSQGLLSEKVVRVALYLNIVAILFVAGVLLSLSSWYLIIVGILVLIGIFAYSGGPYPLSHHALGELSVLIFFGWIPVLVSYYILTGEWYNPTIYCLATSIGLSSVNILVVNNYRDCKEDAQAGKQTLIVRMGRDFAPKLYLSCALLSILVLFPVYSRWSMWLILAYGYFVLNAYRSLTSSEGTSLNKTLGLTARNVFFLAILIVLFIFLR